MIPLTGRQDTTEIIRLDDGTLEMAFTWCFDKKHGWQFRAFVNGVRHVLDRRSERWVTSGIRLRFRVLAVRNETVLVEYVGLRKASPEQLAQVHGG